MNKTIEYAIRREIKKQAIKKGADYNSICHELKVKFPNSFKSIEWTQVINGTLNNVFVKSMYSLSKEQKGKLSMLYYETIMPALYEDLEVDMNDTILVRKCKDYLVKKLTD